MSNGSDIVGCNKPGGKNCTDVVHVKRPCLPDGSPNYSMWGIANWFAPCETPTCQTDADCEQGLVCKDGYCMPEDDEDADKAIVTAKLMSDSYDEDGNPVGKYALGCCCSTYMIVISCAGSVVQCLDMTGVCVDDIPTWDVEEEVLIIRSKEDADDSFCGYSFPPRNAQDEPIYDYCGHPATEWVINNTCGRGHCGVICGEPIGCGFCDCCDPLPPVTTPFEDLEFEVVDFDPLWLFDPEGFIPGSRYCLYACEKCFGHYTPCDNACDILPYGSTGCLEQMACDYDRIGKYVKHVSTGGGNCYGYTGGPFQTSCHELSNIYTGEEVGSSDALYHLPHCEGGGGRACESLLWQSGWGVCDDYPDMTACEACQFAKFTLCDCAELGGCECEDETQILPWIPENVNCTPGSSCAFFQSEVLRLHASRYCTNDCGDSPYGCYSNEGPAMLGSMSNAVVYYDARGGSVCDVGAYGYRGCLWSCLENVDECVGDPHDYPCTQPRNAPYLGFDKNSTKVRDRDFPVSFDAMIEIDTEEVKKDITITFSKNDADVVTGRILNPPLYDSMSPSIYTIEEHRETRKINDFSVSGAVADYNVPHVNEAIYLGNFDKDGGEWSAWVDVTPCYAHTLEHINERIFTFSYTLFAYCNCQRHKKNCKCEKTSWKIGKTNGVTFQL